MRQTVVSSVGVVGQAVHDLAIEGIYEGQIGRLGVSFEGVLGEDFLKHFDILIDNHAKTLTLDDAPGLADSLLGDRLPLSFLGSRNGHSTPNRLVFDLKLPSEAETEHFLIDSGTNYAVFLPLKPRSFQIRSKPAGTLQTLGGSTHCHTDVVALRIGVHTLSSVELASCEGMRSNADVDGMLPTNTFKRLFISHSGAYAIANPRFRKPLSGSQSNSSSPYQKPNNSPAQKLASFFGSR